MIGGILSGIGAIAGGFGLGSKKPPSPEYQSAINLGHERASFNQKMQLAKEHGIHPLAMLGVPAASFSPVYQSGGGIDAGAIGSGLGSLFGASEQTTQAHKGVEPQQHPAPVTDAIEGQRQRLIDAQVRKAEADANMAELGVYNALENLKGQAGRPPGNVVSNDVNAMRRLAAQQAGVPLSYFTGGKDAPISIKQDILPPHPNRPGFAAGTNQGWVNVQDQAGQTGVLNSDVVNADIEKGATLTALAKVFGLERAMQITALLENETLLAAGGVGTAMLLRHPAAKVGKWLLDKFRKTGLPKLKKNPTAPKGGDLYDAPRSNRSKYPDVYPY